MTLFKMILRAIQALTATALCWQGMWQFYRFEDADILQATFSMIASLFIFLSLFASIQIELERKKE